MTKRKSTLHNTILITRYMPKTSSIWWIIIIVFQTSCIK